MKYRSSQVHSRQEVLDYIIWYKKQNDGNSPAIRQIMDACRIPSTSNVHYILNELKASGSIRLVQGASRGIIVTGGQWICNPLPAHQTTDRENAIQYDCNH